MWKNQFEIIFDELLIICIIVMLYFQNEPITPDRVDPDGGMDSGSSSFKLNGKKKIFLMIHVTITPMLLMLLVIKHKNV